MTIHGFIVGIERYAEPGWNTVGPARNAAAIARWLIDIGAPANQVHLFVAPLPVPDDAPTDDPGHALLTEIAALEGDGVDVRRAGDWDPIYKFWSNELAAVDTPNSKLLVFWSGHGVASNTRARMFYHADFRSGLPKLAFNATNFLNHLRTDKFATFSEQIVLADVCGTYSRKDLPDSLDPLTLRKTTQLAYFATPEDTYARGNNGRGVFTDMLLEVLKACQGWPSQQALIEGVTAATKEQEVKPFRIGGFGNAGEFPEAVVGKPMAGTASPLMASLYELLSGLDVVAAMYEPHFLSTVDALAEPELARAQGLLGILGTLASLGDGSSAKLPRGLLQFLVRLQREATLAGPIAAWLDKHAAGQARMIDEIRAQVASEDLILMVLVEAGPSSDVSHIDAYLCSSDFTILPDWKFKRCAVAGWNGFVDEMQALLAPFIQSDGHLGSLEIHFAIDAVLLDRPFHLVPLAAGAHAIGCDVAVVVRYRLRVLDPDGRMSRDCARAIQALSGLAANAIAWTGFDAADQLPRGGGPFLARFALAPPRSGGQVGDAAKVRLAMLLRMGAAFMFLPHAAPSVDWDAVTDELRALLGAQPTLAAFPDTIRVERGYDNALAVNASVLWDDPTRNPFRQKRGLGSQ